MTFMIWPHGLDGLNDFLNHGVLGFDSWQGLGILFFTTTSRTALEPTQPSIQWVPGALSLGAKWLGCEADHSPSSSAKVKECVELYLHSPNTPSRCGAYLSTGTLPFTFMSIIFIPTSNSSGRMNQIGIISSWTLTYMED
jgi:hypothetical protein